MSKKIRALENLSSVVNIPGSKSIANRALITSALADGVSILKNFPKADDCKIMLEALKSYGVEIVEENDTVIKVYGNPYYLKAPKKEIYTANAGTVMRFLTSFSALADGITILTGDKRMLERPIEGLAQALKNLGVEISTMDGFPPVRVKGRKFVGGKTSIDAKESSQFISSILLISPFAEKKIEITLNNPVPSSPYIDLTINVMKTFGVDVNHDQFSYTVNPNYKYKSSIYIIEGDYSSASYFLLAALITKGKILINNLKIQSHQADSKFLEILKNMNCEIKEYNKGLMINAENSELKQLDVDGSNFPDLVPTLSVMALFAEGVSKIRNVKHLRYKETDRLRTISVELRKLGAKVDELEDGLVIYPSRFYKGVEIETHNDHRLAMSFAIAGLMIDGIIIDKPECVSKSFPDFWNEFDKLYQYSNINNLNEGKKNYDR